MTMQHACFVGALSGPAGEKRKGSVRLEGKTERGEVDRKDVNNRTGVTLIWNEVVLSWFRHEK